MYATVLEPVFNIHEKTLYITASLLVNSPHHYFGRSFADIYYTPTLVLLHNFFGRDCF